MSIIDWLIMIFTLAVIIFYGVWKRNKSGSVKGYLMGDRELKWYTIGLSVMATQASAITFLSTPGKAYEDGMGFAQFYFGVPLAMIFLCIFVLPVYYRLNVYTAYEYLEGRFDLKTRSLTAVLFLIQRGLASGITIYAPAIILSNILKWDLNLTIIVIGLVVIFYTVAGGSTAVSVTQKQQMIVILAGMVATVIILIHKLPEGVGLGESVAIADQLDKLEIINTDFDLSNRYTLWSGLIGGFFLFVSYYGTDQSQVQRYLSGRSLRESQMGLLFNGVIKIPMQLLVLFSGVLVFIFFQFNEAPIHFNTSNLEKVQQSDQREHLILLQSEQSQIFEKKQAVVNQMLAASKDENQLAIRQSKAAFQSLLTQDNELRKQVKDLILEVDENTEVADADYVFITFIMNHLPVGLIGLLLAVIFSAAMSSSASEMNALATTTVIDLYKRSIIKERSDQHYLQVSKWMTFGWGLVALFFAMIASLFDNLIEAVNIIGSLFYGTILGIFLVAFFMKRVRGNAVFFAALLVEAIVIAIFIADHFQVIEVAYLWLNLIGCVLVMGLAWLFDLVLGE